MFSVSGPLVLTSCGLSSDADTRVWSEARVNREQRGEIIRPRHITHTPGNNWGGLTKGKMYFVVNTKCQNNIHNRLNCLS